MSHPHTPNTLSSSFMTVTTTAITSAHQNHHTPSYVHSHNHTHLHSHTSGNGNINPASPSKRHHLAFDRQLLAQATAAAAKNGNVGAGSPLWSLARHLQLRLQYARLKVDHGWQKQTIAEVENLYFHQRYAPAGTESVSDQGPGVGVFGMGVGRTIASANLAQRIATVTGGGEAGGLARIVPAPAQGVENGFSAAGRSIQHESGDGGAEGSNSRPPQTPPPRPVDGEDGDENGEQEVSLAGTDVQTPASTPSTTTLANSNPITSPAAARTHLLPSIFPPSASTSTSSTTPRPTNVLPTTHRARTPQNPTTTSTSAGTATTATSLGRATPNTPLSYDSFWSTHTSAATTLRNRR